jgi:hypothetical protein
MLKRALNIGWIDVVGTVVVAVAWAAAGFPRFTEVTIFGGLALLCVGTYFVWMIWDAQR